VKFCGNLRKDEHQARQNNDFWIFRWRFDGHTTARSPLIVIPRCSYLWPRL